MKSIKTMNNSVYFGAMFVLVYLISLIHNIIIKGSVKK
jgi:hypothetical protein